MQYVFVSILYPDLNRSLTVGNPKNTVQTKDIWQKLQLSSSSSQLFCITFRNKKPITSYSYIFTGEHHVSIITYIPRRVGEGGCLNTSPSGFSQISQKRRRGAPPFLVHLFMHYFRTCCETFRPRSLKVRSPGHVKWPHLRNSWNARHSYTKCPITLKLWTIDICTSIYKM